MELVLCINAKRYGLPHNLIEGKVYPVIETLSCSCGNTFIRVEGATILRAPPRRLIIRCKRCGKTLPITVWRMFWYKRFVPINDTNVKLEEDEKELMDA